MIDVRSQFILAILATVLAFSSTAMGQDFNKGLESHDRGDYAGALREFHPLAEQGHALAQHNLGLMYDNGQGIPQNFAEAARWYRLAAEQGYAKAQYNLGVMYRNGEGIPQNFAEAARWYRLAAEQGYANGQQSLGRLYAEGRGVPKDYVLSHKWINLAAAQGIESATQDRDLVAARMTPAQIAEAQKLARQWLEVRSR